MTIRPTALLLATFLATPAVSLAIPEATVRIGDFDGFGFGSGDGLLGADNAAVKRVGDLSNHLEINDLLPDLDGSGKTAAGKYEEDDFDNRSGEGITCEGDCTLNETESSGAQFTDISLSMTYDRSKERGTVYDHNTGTRGTGGDFPTPPSKDAPNQPGFMFDFNVAKNFFQALDDKLVAFQMIFADYDVVPASVQITRADGTTKDLAVKTQHPVEAPKPETDGLIQLASVDLTRRDIFTLQGDRYHGFIKVDFDARNEPYTAFDFVQLRVIGDPDPRQVPVPATLFLMLLGLALLRFRRGIGKRASSLT